MRHHSFSLPSSTAAKQAALWAAAKQPTDNMPDNNKSVGWRKKIQNKPKELQPLKPTKDDASTNNRLYFTRKTVHTSRPSTPATPTVEEPETGRIESVESTTPRRSSKPKLIRYTSLFSSFKDLEPTSPDFSEPWDNTVPEPIAYVDPMMTIQSLRAHIARYSKIPLTPEHTNGLLCIFEHYCMLRSVNEGMEATLQDTRQELETARARWTNEEHRYAAEIRRLELLIAQGTTGVAGYVRTSFQRSH